MTPADVYRAPMRSRRDDVIPGLAVQRALAMDVCGIGGLLAPPPVDLSEALDATERTYGDPAARRLERFTQVLDGSFVWSRDADGLYLLGRIDGPWRYDSSPEAAAVDLVHLRDCEWLDVPVAERDVPPATVHTFARGGRNFQQTHHPDIAEQTRRVWDRGRR